MTIEQLLEGPAVPISSRSLIACYAISIEEMESIHQILKREYPATKLMKEEEKEFIFFALLRVLRCKAF